MPRKDPYMFMTYEQKLVIFAFYGFLMSYCPLCWGSRAIYNDLKTRYMFESYDQKLVVFLFFGHFHELFPTVFGFHADLQGL